MRPLTPFVSYLDNEGLPLVGRIRFCNTDGSPAQVFGSDGTTSLGSTVFTDSSGRSVRQPFLEDHDYLIFFDKYVGHSTMTEDNEEDSWAEQGSAIDRYNTVGVSLEEECYRTVDDIASLRSTVPLADGEMILLLGYNTKFDKDPIYYKWDSFASSDDGGSVIKVSGVDIGRWVLLECPRYLDVRHFGAFPMEGMEASSWQNYRIQAAGSYAHANGCGLFFYANGEDSFYDVSALDLYDVDCSTNARLFSTDENNVATITGIRSVYCADGDGAEGTIRLVDRTVRSSWQGESSHAVLVPSERLVVDSNILYSGQPTTFSNIDVEMLEYSYCILDGCTITSNGVISGPITIRNCELKTSWFADSYDFDGDLVAVDNKILLSNCKDAQTYILLKNKQGEADYGDLRRATVSEKDLLDGCFIENAVLYRVSLLGGSVLRNVSGSVFFVNDGFGHNWSDSDIEILGTTSGATSFALARSSVTGGTVFVSGSVNLVDSEIGVTFDVSGDMFAKGCGINSAMRHRPTSSTVREVFMCDTFSAVLEIYPQVSGSVFDAIWANNVGKVSSLVVPGPIYIDRTNVDPDDDNHTYVYRDNGGTFIPSKTTACKVAQLTVKSVSNFTDQRTESIVRNAGALTLISPTFIQTGLGTTSAGVYNYGGNYFDSVAFFRIGTSAFRVGVDIAMLARKATMSQSVTASRQVLGAEFVSGFTFRLKTPLNGEWSGSNKALNQFPSMYSTVLLSGFVAGDSTPVELPEDFTLDAEIRYESLDAHL